MHKSVSWGLRFPVIAGMALGLAGCGGNDVDLKQYAQSHNMSATKEAAFTTCYTDFKRSPPVLTTPDGNVRMSKVPPDICACEADAIVAVFQGDQFETFSTFTLYLSRLEKKHPALFYAKALKPGNKPTEAGKTLETAFNSCLATYKTAHPDEVKKLFELIPPPAAKT